MEAPELLLLCQGCLSEDRNCNVIDKNSLNIFIQILDLGSDSKTKQDINYLSLCWECNAILRKIRTFQLKVQKARNILKKHILLNIKTPSLSTLKTVTKTNIYDAEIIAPLRFEEITISKIVAIKKDEEIDINNIKEERNLKESPRNYDISDNAHNRNEFDHISKEKTIGDINIEHRVLKRKPLEKYLKKSIKKEDSADLPILFNPDRPRRIKKSVARLEIPFKKKVQKQKGKTKIMQIVETKQCRALEVSKPNKQKELVVHPSGSEKEISDGATEQISDANFSAIIKPNHYNINSRYTKVRIDKDNLLQYFTKYTLSVPEYRSFLQELAKNPYFAMNKWKCTKCVVKFLDEEDYVQHMKLHDSKMGSFSCSLCDLHFLDENQLNAHLTSHLTVRQCNICKLYCGLQHSLSGHMIEDHGDGCIFQCTRCNLVFGSRSEVNRHFISIHRRLVCDDCGKVQKTKRTMAKHCRWKHMKPRCPHCSLEFSSYRCMGPHLILKHNYPEKKKCKKEDIYCVECNKQFTMIQKFRNHINKVHKPNKDRIPCSECDKVFTRRHYLQNHMKLFHGEGTEHRCEPCNKSFSSSYNLRLHTDRVHKKIPIPRTKVCDTCGLGFHTNNILIKHMRTHTGERPYECSYCPARFAQKYARDVHVRKQHLQRNTIEPTTAEGTHLVK